MSEREGQPPAPETLAETVGHALRLANGCRGELWKDDTTFTDALAALDSLLALVASEKRESADQMASKLDAQMALMAITKALDLTLADMGNGWTEGVMHILARIETIVDEADRLASERDAAVRDAATLREAARNRPAVGGRRARGVRLARGRTGR